MATMPPPSAGPPAESSLALTSPKPAELSLPEPSTSTSSVLIVESRGSMESGEVPSTLAPLKLATPSTPTSHTGLPIGRSQSISIRNRSDSPTSSLLLGGPSTPTGSTTPRGASPLPGGAATLVIPTQQSRISVASNMTLTPSTPTSPSSTHIGNILAPASFFRPSRPSQQPAMTSSRSVSHSIGPPPAPSHRTSTSMQALNQPPRKNGAIPDSAIPLASFAARRNSLQGTRVSRSSSLSDNIPFNGTLAEDVEMQQQQPRPMASREPLLSPLEQVHAQESRRQSLASVGGVRNSLERIFRRSFSGESLRVPLRKERSSQALSPVSDHTNKDRKQARFVIPPVEGLNVVHPPWMKPLGTSRATGKLARNYELHAGANRFLFRGRAMLGGDLPFAFIGTLLVYSIFVGFWMGTTCVWWWKNLSPALAGVGVYLCLLTLSALLATAFRDPGILPRDLDLDAPLPHNSDGDSASAVPLPREIRVRDEVIRTKYCVTCRTYRPPRASHCRNCDNCVDSCDHHCPWVNNCVGRRNYGSFITCLVAAELSLILILVTSAIHISLLSSREHLQFAETLRKGFGSAITFLAASIFIWPVGTLMGYHVRLLILNTTTIEQVRKKAHKSLGAGAGPPPANPFTYGSWSYNVAYMLCRPVGYSWIEADAVALDDKRERPPEEDFDEDRWSRSDVA